MITRIPNTQLLDILKDESNYSQYGFHTQKGKMLLGNTGNWKTTMMHQYLDWKWINPITGQKRNGHRLTHEGIMEGNLGLGHQSLNDYYLFIDELGANEQSAIVEYGTTKHPVKSLIKRRYDNWLNHKNGIKPLESPDAGYNYFASNYNLEQLTRIFGKEVVSRFYDLCDIIIVEGQDSRLLNYQKDSYAGIK